MNKARQQHIESRADRLRLELWNCRDDLFNPIPTDPIQALDPGVGLHHLGYTAKTVATLGGDVIEGRRVMFAGMLDDDNKLVWITSSLSPQTRLYTAAHELGHAALHAGNGVVFRDIPLDGPRQRKSDMEQEADFFAACFLMPAQLLKRAFAENFGPAPFRLTNETAYAMGTSFESFNQRHPQLRDVARALGQARHYNGREVQQLAARFGVSATTMAIRIDELALVAR